MVIIIMIIIIVIIMIILIVIIIIMIIINNYTQVFRFGSWFDLLDHFYSAEKIKDEPDWRK